MAESDDLDDLDGGETPEASTSSRKRGGLGNLLPTILKFAAIGIGAIIFIVTIVVVTMNIRDKRGHPQTSIDPLSPYVAVPPAYTYFTEIGQISTKTRDEDKHYTVTVNMYIGYEQNNQAAASELSVRRYNLQDFTRSYFAGKYAEELRPENEENLKREIKERLNNRYLAERSAKDILFSKLDVMETF